MPALTYQEKQHQKRMKASLLAFFDQAPYLKNFVNWCRLDAKDEWYLWQNEQGFGFRFTEAKRIKLIYPDKEFLSQDLLYFADLDTLQNNSINFIIYEKHHAFIGKDNRLRIRQEENFRLIDSLFNISWSELQEILKILSKEQPEYGEYLQQKEQEELRKKMDYAYEQDLAVFDFLPEE